MTNVLRFFFLRNQILEKIKANSHKAMSIRNEDSALVTC